jgi:hypothetical protein
MSDTAQFDASLPAPYKENWREAYRADDGDSPRSASYQAPGGEAIPFIQKSFRFSGGQARDTAEYPFGGLWSNEYLNEKPQSLTVEGYVRGPAYIARRNRLIEALRVPTDDDHPGYIDLPFWGRFPVVVGDNYEVSENTDEQGQCAVSITFIRAGVSVTERAGGGDAGGADALLSSEAAFEKAAENLETAAIADFETRLPDDKLDKATLASCFGRLKSKLLGILGRIQGMQTTLNAMTAEVLGIINLINRGVLLPRELARTLFNAGASIVGGVLEIKNSIALYGRRSDTVSSLDKPSLPLPDNEKNVLVVFLSVDANTLSGGSDDSGGVSGSGGSDDSDGSSGSDGSDGESGSGGSDDSGGASGSGGSDSPGGSSGLSGKEVTETAIDNLYRTMAFLSSARIIVNMDSLTYEKAQGYWRLLEKLEHSIDRENPCLYAAVRDLRAALSRELSRSALNAEMIRNVSAAAPLLCLAYYLGCDEDKLRELNRVADSFIIEGDVIYV